MPRLVPGLRVAHSWQMPRWLTTLLVLLLLIVFVLPNPASAGNAAGNAVDSLVVFVRSIGNEIGGTVTTSEGTADLSGEASGSAQSYPYGAVASGDGTFRTAPAAVVTAPVPVPAPVTSGDASPDVGAEGVLRQSQPLGLQIAAIGVSTGFVGLGLEPDGTLEVPETAQVAGWYRDAPTPGERGTAVVTAHVDWRQEKGVFHDLGRMRPGDELTVDRADGSAVVFRVTRMEEYPKSQFPTEEVYGATDGAELRLITCSGTFDPGAHSYSDNLVVFARMVRVS